MIVIAKSVRAVVHEFMIRADVVIIPSTDLWNDFGFRIRVEFVFLDAHGAELRVPGYFAVEGESDTSAFADAVLSLESILPLDRLRKPYASLLLETKAYSQVRRVMGVDQGHRLLRELHDLSVLNMDGESVPGWSDIEQSDVFARALTRASESYFAFRRGANVLHGMQTSGDDARQRISVDFSAEHQLAGLDFEFDRTNALRGRIAILVGKNGTGKTRSLGLIAKGLAGTDESVSFSQRPAINQVLAFVHESSLSLFRPQRGQKRSAQVRAFAFGPGRKTSFVVSDSTTALILDIARGHDSHSPLLNYLRDLVMSEFAGCRIMVPLRGVKNVVPHSASQYVDLDLWSRGSERNLLDSLAQVDHLKSIRFVDENLKIRKFSAGQIAFLRFSLHLLSNAGPASVVLVDEPENFLHPNLISQFMNLLHRLLDSTGSVAIIATHSPFVVREVQSANVQVLVRNAENRVEVKKPMLQTLGASVSNVSDAVFGDDLPTHLFEYLIADANIGSLPFGEILDRYSEELSPEALMMLRRKSEGDNEKA